MDTDTTSEKHVERAKAPSSNTTAAFEAHWKDLVVLDEAEFLSTNTKDAVIKSEVIQESVAFTNKALKNAGTISDKLTKVQEGGVNKELSREDEKPCDSLILIDEQLETDINSVEKDKTERKVFEKTELKAYSEAKVNSELKVNSEAKANSGPKVNSGPKANSGPKVNSEPKANPGPKANSGLKANPESKPNLEPKSEVIAKRYVQSTKTIWISNITDSTKASELKSFVSKTGKVVTAKVVTDGKNCYGFIMMETPEEATECIKKLNETHIQNRKVFVSATPPSKSASKTQASSANNTEHPIKTEEPEATKDNLKRHYPRKHHSPTDPLTTKFRSRSKERSVSRKRSRSTERHDHRDYLREMNRLQRKLIEEQRRSREEVRRQLEHEERKRELEYKLERERRQLQLERALFERERRELIRMDVERRRIEKERFDVMHERARLERFMKQPDSKLRKDTKKAFAYVRKEEKPETKQSRPSSRVLAQPERKGKAPPPPDITSSRTRKHSDSERSKYGDTKKDERGRYCSERKYDRGAPDRKYDYGVDAKRHRDEYHPKRESNQRVQQWLSAVPVNYSEPWRNVPSGVVVAGTYARCQDGFQPGYGGSARIPSFYYQPTAGPQEYQRYEHGSQSNKKY